MAMSTEDETARLLAICDAATPGPWRIEREELPADFGDALGAPTAIGPLVHVEHAGGETNDEACAAFEADAEFIATFSPDRVRLMVKERAKLRRLLQMTTIYLGEQFRCQACDARIEDGHLEGCDLVAARALLARTGSES